MSPVLIQAMVRRDNEQCGDSLLDRLRRLTDDALRIAGKAEQLRQFPAAIAAIREVGRHVELIARLSGRLGDGSTNVNIAIVQQKEKEELRDLSRLTTEELRELERLETKMRTQVEDAEFRRLDGPQNR